MDEISLTHIFKVSDFFIEVFNKEIYEPFVLELMNQSSCIFPNTYTAITSQSSGECDYISTKDGTKFDAKLPFYSNQIKLLTDGKKHKPLIMEWIKEMQNEASEFNPFEYRNNGSDYIKNLKLYQIIKKRIQSDKPDENIIFFLPYPITLFVKDGTYLQLASDYLDFIYNEITKDVDLSYRKIYGIYPSSEKNCFVIRQFGKTKKECLFNDTLEKYFSFEVVENLNTNK